MATALFIVGLLIVGLIHLLSVKIGIEPLDSGNNHLCVFRDSVIAQSFHLINGIEGITVLRKVIVAEVIFCLFAQVVAVYEEEDAVHRGIGEESVSSGAG